MTKEENPRIGPRRDDDFSLVSDAELGLAVVAEKLALIERLADKSAESNLAPADLCEAIRCVAIVARQEARNATARLARDARRRGLFRVAEVTS
jgi:hypothetical protein